MKIPEKVKIGGLHYSVALVDEIDHNREIDGAHTESEQLIRIRKDCAPDYAKKVFLHETLHAIECSMNMELQRDEEEKIVESFANGLLMFIEDNPEIFK